jgi:serine/threonine-protein kinase
MFDSAEADATVNKMIAKHQADMAFQIAEVFAFRGEADRAFAWLDRALLQWDNGLTQIRNPLFANIERDSRYAAFLAKMRLAPAVSLARTTR